MQVAEPVPGEGISAGLPDGGRPAEGLAGLTVEVAAARLAEHGPNDLPQAEKRKIWHTVWEVVREPMFVMLVAAGALYLVLGEPADAALLLFFVFVVMGITVVQERRTERALDALRDLSSPQARVIRDGATRTIPGREVVPGDLLVLSEGDRVGADGLLVRSAHLSVDESLLTGESVPVRKVASDVAVGQASAEAEAPGGDDRPSVFSGTFVTSGHGVAEVVRTGANTEIGRIGAALSQIRPDGTALQRETGRLVKVLATVGFAACVVVVVGYAASRGGSVQVWKEGLLAGIAMAMAILPEEFPVILTIFLALGAWRISRSRVLTRRMPAIEALGATTVLCVDKTGTLTENRMTVRQIWTQGATRPPTDPASVAVLEVAVRASRDEPFDPMERALQAALGRTETAGGPPVREYPLGPELLAMTLVRPDGGVASKGAPEAIGRLCRVDPATWAEALARMTDAGLRVLGVARGQAAIPDLPASQADLQLEFVGLVGFEDPLREKVPAAVAECRTAGIRVVMITGDAAGTASSIARQAGISDPERVVTGPELAAMSDEALAVRAATTSVFARVVPEQKLRIVTAFAANGAVVAMTGDGVNDAPALKAAQIGIAMGGRGTDVAREAASLVLLDDDFSSIVAAIRLGRRIYDNVRKAVSFTLAVHVPIAGLSILPVFLSDWPMILFPVHIVFLELIIDPSCTLVFEGEGPEGDVMTRPPRDPRARLFDRRMLVAATLQGLSSLVACLVVVGLARGGHGPDAARALSFVTLVASFLAIILVNRSWSRTAIGMFAERNRSLGWVVAGTALFLTLAVSVPWGRTVFHFAPLHPGDLALAVGLGFASVLWVDLDKLRRRWAGRRSAARVTS
ncbi:MAG: cation-translocating P-type ATPase [Myxococcota bacterium]